MGPQGVFCASESHDSTHHYCASLYRTVNARTTLNA
jgi:hypothetical protein